MKKTFCIFLLLVCNLIYGDFSKNYYKGTEDLSGKALKSKLHTIIKGHKQLEYDDLWKHLSYTDEDPKNKNNVILFYCARSISKRDQARGWKHKDNDSFWNREHIWAKSLGQFNTNKPAGTDLHHIRATDKSVNKMRGRKFFDNGGYVYDDPDGGVPSKTDQDSWEPRDEIKGDIARMLFYMAVRYEGAEGIGGPDLELEDKVISSGNRPVHGKLSTLLEWHKADPVDSLERARNDKVYGLQKNRNPFIDHPEFVEKIWNNNGVMESTDTNKKTKINAISVKKALKAKNGSQIVVIGFIRDEINQQYGMQLADSMNAKAKFLAIKIPTEELSTYSPFLNKKAKGKRVIVTGSKEHYMGNPGIKSVTSISFVD